jgi:hypothetical protein
MVIDGTGYDSKPNRGLGGDQQSDYQVTECQAGGISVISIPRREVARLRGVLRLSELPRHKPTIVFDSCRQTRDTEDE